MKRPTDAQLNDLYNVLLSIGTAEQMAEFLDDLCTRKEVEQMAMRLYAARMLIRGDTYAKAQEESGLSSATVSRVSRCVQYSGGYAGVIAKSDQAKENP